MGFAPLSKNKQHWNAYTVYQIYDEKRAFASDAVVGTTWSLALLGRWHYLVFAFPDTI